ncbi:hypothetical protein D039_0193B, partial [Vibrio parahaemolyticus EKP-028]
SDILTRT